MSGGVRLGVLGATGAVGSTVLRVLEERDFPVSELVPLASERSAGKRLQFAGGEVEVQPLSDESIQGLDLVISSAGGSVSSEWAPKLIAAGAVVIDNTSFWRMYEDVLVVAEVNPDDSAEGHRNLIASRTARRCRWWTFPEADRRRGRDRRWIACAILGVILGQRQGKPCADRGSAMEDAAPARGAPTRPRWYVCAHGSPAMVAAEMDLDGETCARDRVAPGVDWACRRRPGPRATRGLADISATCVRVPVFGLLESINVPEYRDPLSPDELRRLLGGAPA